MSAVALDWFERWAVEHVIRCAGARGLPTDAKSNDWLVFFDGYEAAFIEDRVSREEADHASAKLQGSDEARFANQHLPALRRFIRDQRAAEAAAIGAAASAGPDAARAASLGCPECAGCGWASREQRLPGRVPSRFALACRCPFGRVLAARYRGGDDFKLSRVADLQEHPELWEHGLHFAGWSRAPAPSDRGPIPGALRPRPASEFPIPPMFEASRMVGRLAEGMAPPRPRLVGAGGGT